VLARLGVPTGDGRIIAPSAGSSRDLPLPLAWQELSGDGHGGSMIVGRIETLHIGDGMVTATGTMLDSAPYAVIEQLEAGLLGPSVDLDDIEYTMDDRERLVITRWRIAGATLVAIPAFADVSLTLADLPEEDCDPVTEPDCADPYGYGLMASVRSSGWSDMPIADEGRDWDGSAAAGRVFAWATDGETTDWGRYARAFLRKDDSANPETRGAYGFGIADVIGGTLTIVPRGVFAAAAAVQGARTGSAPEDAAAMKSVLRGIYARMDRPAPFAMTAAAAPSQLPPLDWFRQPDLDRLTPLTISDTGRVFGHIAGWGQCHIGLPGCVTPPNSVSDYVYFHVGEQPTADGAVLPVGTLVAGPTHCRDLQAGFRAAQQHYDDPSAAVAKVMAGEDDYGIWVAGWMLPGATQEALRIFRSSPVSGDWRRVAGNLEMVAVCSVNAPGFPVPRARVAFSNGHQQALIGTFGITPVSGEWADAVRQNASFVKTQDETARAKWAWAQTGME
jgi:hypothetical protein